MLDQVLRRTLSKTKTIEVIINFPLGMAIQRLLTKSGEIPEGWQISLGTFFGSPVWRELAYEKGTDLFGPGRGASRSGSGHHACSVQATSRAQSGARRRIIFFAATKVRILPARHIEQSAAMLFHPCASTMPAKSVPQLHVGNAAARTRTVSAAPFRPNRQKFPRQYVRI